MTPVKAPYQFTEDGARIEKTGAALPGTIAALMHEEGKSHGRLIRGWTDATTAGFAGHALDGKRKLVYRDGDKGAPCYVCAVELPGNHLSAPAPFDGEFPLDGMTVWHYDIGGVPPSTVGVAPALGLGMHHHHQYVVQMRYTGKEPGRDHDWHTVKGGVHGSDNAAMNQIEEMNSIAWQHKHGPHQFRVVENG